MPHRPQLSTTDYVQGVLAGNRTILAQTLTLIESDAPRHSAVAQEVLRQLLPHSGRSLRLGITGVPGVGKSTLIEALGVHLVEQGRRVAVLAIDPSSSLSRGSILGDKTRMTRLSQRDAAFIRPSPTGGALGGVARKTRESMIVCEAAGFDRIIVETVGVGQSEISVRAMTDCFVLLALTGAGDELQAIKKGVVELADLIVVTKADGPNRTAAQAATADYQRALRYLAAPEPSWQPRVLACSATTGEGLATLWQALEEFHATGQTSGTIAARRRSQSEEWLLALISEELQRRFMGHPGVAARLPELRQAVIAGQIPVVSAVTELLERFTATPGGNQ